MVDSLVNQLLARNPTAIGRALSRVERGGEDARELIRAIFSSSGRAQIVGVTGPPGTGKSTLVNELAKEFTRRGHRVGVIAVDPSSPFTGGAILGDRLRMQELSGTGVFIRSMASRGQLGGLAAAAADAATVLDAAGYDLIFIETVGAGQGDVDIAKNAHTTVVVEAPGLGDELQAIKAGILEIADILIVNKAEREGANAAVAALELNLNLNKVPSNVGSGTTRPYWRPPVLKTTALRGEGVASVANAIEQHAQFLNQNGLKAEKEKARVEDELVRILQRELLTRALAQFPTDLPQLVARVATRELDVYSAVEEVLDRSGKSVGPLKHL